MATPALDIADFERVMTELFLPAETTGSYFTDSDFDRISRLLDRVGKPQWSRRPRTYAVLRMIDQVDLFDSFILDGLKDIAFPYTEGRLPPALSPSGAAKFLQKQSLVLTKASDLEKSDGRHRHLARDADVHFDSLKILGRGAFGEVDHVRSKLSLEEYARKRVHRKKAFSRDQEAIRMFENELTNLKRLSHHHLVKFVGSYTDQKFVGLLISPVADCDLKVFLERGPFPKDDLHLLRGFFGCLCSGILYLHSCQIRHKDLKPGNILVFNKKILITDFGTARDWSGQSRSTTTGASSAYTPGYAPPEVVEDEPRSSSSDIWSLGCVFLDMMTILGGETLASRAKFFAENGTCGANPRSNPVALQLWLARLDTGADMQPLKWIRQMIRHARNERITAAALMDQIRGCEDGHVYCSSCCSGEDESEDENSYQGSVFEEETTEMKGAENLSGVRKGDGAATVAVHLSDPDLHKVLSQRQGLTLGSEDDTCQAEVDTALHSSDTTSERSIANARAAELLVANGFTLSDSSGFTDALSWASKNGHESAVQLLLDMRPNAAKHLAQREKPINFKDCVGRKFLFPFHLCSTWTGMEELIKKAFLYIEAIGPRVFEGQYDLVGPNGEFILPQVWEATIEPGWNVTMYMWPLPEPPVTDEPLPLDDALISAPKESKSPNIKKSRPPQGLPRNLAWIAGRTKSSKTGKSGTTPDRRKQSPP